MTSDGRRNLHLFWSPLQHETRMFKEARACLELGVFDEVHVLGYGAPGLPAQERHASGLSIHRLLTPSARMASASRDFGRYVRLAAGAVSLAHYAGAAVRFGFRLKPTHITCHNPALLPMAFVAALCCGARVVYAPHELEIERAGLTGMVKHLSVAPERWFIRRCTAVVVVNEPIAAWYREHYGLEQVHVVRAIPEGHAVEARDVAARDAVRQMHGVSPDALLFIYQGLLEPSRGVDLLLETFLGLEEPFHLMLMGFGGSEERSRDAAEACPRIHFQPAVPIDQIVRYSGAADVGVFALADPVSRSYQLSLPNKFFEYVAAGLPVLVSDNLELLSSLVRDHRLGWVAPSDTLRQTIESIGRDDISERVPAVARFAAAHTWERERLIYVSVYGREAEPGPTPGDRA